MLTDERIGTALGSLLAAIDTPPVNWREIRRRIPERGAVRSRIAYPRIALAAAAALAIAVLTLPSIAPAIVQSMEARYRQAVQALGGIAPPPVPNAVLSSLSARPATLASARSRVQFTIVPPAGLPRGIVSSTLETAPAGIYDKSAAAWQAGPVVVFFTYKRAGGGTFMLMAERFDPRDGLPAKYMFEALGPAPGGKPVLVRHEHFAWRNGDQIMQATQSDALSSADILRIQTAMHGRPVALRNLHAPDTSRRYKVYRLPTVKARPL